MAKSFPGLLITEVIKNRLNFLLIVKIGIIFSSFKNHYESSVLIFEPPIRHSIGYK